MKWGKLGIVGATASAALAVGSCATTPENCRLNYTATGAVVGAAAGAGVGAAIAASSGASGGGIAAATAGGAVVGGLLGAVAGRQQDQACRQMALNQALNQAMAVNEFARLPAEADIERIFPVQGFGAVGSAAKVSVGRLGKRGDQQLGEDSTPRAGGGAWRPGLHDVLRPAEHQQRDPGHHRQGLPRLRRTMAIDELRRFDPLP